ncbi:MAG: hypothetical protein LIO81_02360 [Clostridiales bacterium]|nr:hypothetical protein [Clostridiales bacterium]
MLQKKEGVVVSLSDKRLLSIEEFSMYTGIGVVKVRELADVSNSIFRAGRRLLVDRVKFDRWCDEHDEM